MLFKTIEEFKKQLPVGAEVELKDLTPSIEQKAERDFLIPYGLGTSLYNVLNAAYNSNTPLVAIYTALLPYAQAAIANYAYMRYLPFAQVVINKEGVRITKSETSSTAFEWQIKQLSAELNESAWQAIEALLKFVETNVSDYPQWQTSTAYTYFTEGFIRNTTQFNDLVKINESRRLFNAMRYIMRRHQAAIKSITGDTLYAEILAQVQPGGTVTSDNEKLLDFICPTIAYLTASDALIEMPVTFTPEGLVIVDGTTEREISGGPRDTNKFTLINKYATIGNSNIKALLNFLQDNTATYPTFVTESLSYVAPPEDTTEYTGESVDTDGFSGI